MHLSTTQHVFGHSWAIMTTANWKKYPNAYSPHILSVDVISRTVTPSGCLETQRLVVCKQSAPSVFRVLGFHLPDVNYFIEQSTLNPKTQEYEAITHNLSLRKYFTAEEMITFAPLTDSTFLTEEMNKSIQNSNTSNELNPNSTLFTCTAKITAVGALATFGSLIEQACVSRFKANASRGRLGLESVIEAVLEEAKEIELKANKGWENISGRWKDGLKGFI